jgi:hypothetical protein
MDKVKKPSNSECYTPSSEPFRIDLIVVFFIYSGWVRLSPLGTSALIGLLYQPRMTWWWVWSSRWNENWQMKPKYSEKTCPTATFSTTNPTWPELGSNPGRGRKPETNRLSYDTPQTGHLLKKRWGSKDVFFPPPLDPNQVWGPPSLLSNGFRRSYIPEGKAAEPLSSPLNPYPVSMLKVRGTGSPGPHVTAWSLGGRGDCFLAFLWFN